MSERIDIDVNASNVDLALTTKVSVPMVATAVTSLQKIVSYAHELEIENEILRDKLASWEDAEQETP